MLSPRYPGVIRSDGYLGSLILRGSTDDGNKYYIDEIPLFYPKHYGGFALIIPTNFISNINVYSSTPPIEFSQVYGGVIEIESQDEVNKMKGFVEITPFIQSSIYFQIPFKKKSKNENEKDINLGYSISSIRVAYLDYVARPIITAIFREQLGSVRINFPFYLDYQQKFRFFLTQDNKHSIKFLFLGSLDRYRKETDKVSDSERALTLQSNVDAIANIAQIDSDIETYVSSMRYVYKPFYRMENQLILYHSYNRTRNYKYVPDVLIEAGGVSSEDIVINRSEITNNLVTNIVGIKDVWEWNYWKNIGYIKIGVEYQYVHYGSSGQIELVKSPNFSSDSLTGYILASALDNVISGVDDVFEIVDSNFQIGHHYVDAYLKKRFKFFGFLIEGGARIAYLHFTRDIAPNFWGNIEYEIEKTRTSFFVASGYYTSFVQTNFYKVNKPISQQTIFATSKLKPENSVQVTGGAQQVFLDLYKIKVEGFYTIMEDIAYIDFNAYNADFASRDYIILTSSLRHYGVEVFLIKDAVKNRPDFFFWASYTYTISRYKNPSTRDEFVPFVFQQKHAVKVSGGFRFINHQVAIKFELYSGFPYTPLTQALRAPGTQYYTPSSEGAAINSAEYPLSHRLDLRYTYTHYQKWGKWSLYAEIINVYSYRSNKVQRFNYLAAYEKGKNPILAPSASDLPILFNIGFELQF